MSVDPVTLRAWVIGRSRARRLPLPVLDRGGLRVDTNSADEVCRWFFPAVATAVGELAQTCNRPAHLLKVCASADEVQAALPADWRAEATGHFMTTTQGWDDRPLPAGYSIEVERHGDATRARIRSSNGDVAASGFAAQTSGGFVYDRINTAPEHRRRGLGQALMTALRRTCHNPRVPGLLVATDDGRALYQRLGWQCLSPYSTANVVAS